MKRDDKNIEFSFANDSVVVTTAEPNKTKIGHTIILSNIIPF